MNVIIGCEKSQIIAREFRARGHNAVSCDILPCEHPEWGIPHIQDDVLKHLDDGWDLGIFHPPCTRLSNSGVWTLKNPDKLLEMVHYAKFFKNFLHTRIPKVCIENPVIHKYAAFIIETHWTQTIQPYQFGEPESKRTCLWLQGLPKLKPTKILPLPASGHWQNQTPSGQNRLSPSKHRAADRARTYTGVAKAMAEQWG